MSTPTPPRPRFVLELEDAPAALARGAADAPPDPARRLARLEKFLGRSWGFRCVRHAEVPPGWRVAVVKPEALEEEPRG